MESLFKYNAMKLVTQNYQKKVTLFKKYLLLKKFLFRKISCLEEAPASKKYIFCIITYSGGKTLSK